MVLSAILIGGLYPAIVQKFQVQPNEQAKEAPYIKKNIEATRAAYGIDDAEVTDYSGKGDAPRTPSRSHGRRLGGQLPADRPERRLAGLPAAPAGAQVLPVPVHARRRPVHGHRRQGAGHRHRSARAEPRRHPEAATGSTTTSPTPTATALSRPRARRTGTPTAPGRTRTSPSRGPARPPATLGTYQQRIYYGEKTQQYSIVGGPAEGARLRERTASRDHELRGQERRQPRQPDQPRRVRGGLRRAADPATRAPSARVRGSSTTARPRTASRRSRPG